ncbi:MAG: hypothetical protein AABY00_02770 [Nanoarchaeota archaeon]
MISAGSITYVLTTFHAIEEFDDPKYNDYSVKNSDPKLQRILSPRDMDPSLRNASPKQVLDFIVDHGGTLRKEHSTISCVRAFYRASHQDCKFVSARFAREMLLEEYVALGKPESFTLHLAIETPAEGK